MEVCNTWQCVNSFAAWASALGTLAISGMSLWLATRDRRVSLKIEADAGFVLHPTEGNVDMIGVCITNIGRRPTFVTNYSWSVRKPFKRLYVWTSPYYDSVLGNFCTKLPVELKDGQEAKFFHPVDYFLHNDNERLFFTHSRVMAWWRIRTLRVRAHVTIGPPRVGRVNRRLRKRLWEQYREFQQQLKAAPKTPVQK